MQEIEIYNKTGEIIDISIPVEENNIGAVKIAEFQKYKTHVDIDFFLGEINTIRFNETGSASDKNDKRLFRQQVLTEIKNHANIRELFKHFFNYLCGGSNNLNDFQDNPLILIPVGGNPITLFFRLIVHIADAKSNDDIKIGNFILIDTTTFERLKPECELIKPKIIAYERFLSLSDCDFNLMPIITEEAKRPKKRRKKKDGTITTKEVINAGFILTRLKAAFEKIDKNQVLTNNKYKEQCFRSLISILKTYPVVDTKNYLYDNNFIFQQLQSGNLDEIIQKIEQKIKEIDESIKEENDESKKKEIDKLKKLEKEAIVYIEFLKKQKTEVALMTREIINMIASYYDPINKKFQDLEKEENQALFDSLSNEQIHKDHFENLTAFIRQICLTVNAMLSTKNGPFYFIDTYGTIRSTKLRSVLCEIYKILLTNSTINIEGLLTLLKKKYLSNSTPKDFKISIINTQNNGYFKKFKEKLEELKVAINVDQLKGATITANILSLNVGKSQYELKQMLLQGLENSGDRFIEDININYNRNVKKFDTSDYMVDPQPDYQNISQNEQDKILTADEVADMFKGGRKKLNKTKRKKKKKYKHTKKRKKYILRKKHKTRKKKL